MMGFGHYTVSLAQKEKFGENIFEIMTHSDFNWEKLRIPLKQLRFLMKIGKQTVYCI